MRPVWAEINLGAIAHNLEEVKKLIRPEVEIMAIVKANAYGHGAVEVSRTALAAGAGRLGVAILDEAMQLREAGFEVPILVLGYTPEDQVDSIISHDITQTIYTWEQAEVLSQAGQRLGRKAQVHLKIDTGMGRLGIVPTRESVSLIRKIYSFPGLEVEGLFTHLAKADAGDKSNANWQLDNFRRLIDLLEKEGIKIPVKHAANSAAIIDLPEAHFNLVRAGIMLYGLYPSNEVEKDQVNLRPALSLKARVAFVKKVSSNTAISYGGTFITKKPTVVATLPLGYADGYTRILSNRGEALVNGERAKIIGRVCMDQCMLDVTDVGVVKIGDEVTLIGRQDLQEITADELAHKIGTINYEITCMISYRVPRTYLP